MRHLIPLGRNKESNWCNVIISLTSDCQLGCVSMRFAFSRSPFKTVLHPLDTFQLPPCTAYLPPAYHHQRLVHRDQARPLAPRTRADSLTLSHSEQLYSHVYTHSFHRARSLPTCQQMGTTLHPHHRRKRRHRGSRPSSKFVS